MRQHHREAQELEPAATGHIGSVVATGSHEQPQHRGAVARRADVPLGIPPSVQGQPGDHVRVVEQIEVVELVVARVSRHDARRVRAVVDRDRHADRAVIHGTGTRADEASVVEGFGVSLGHLDRHRIGKVDHRVLDQRHGHAVIDAPELGDELHVVERHVAGGRSRVLADRASRQAAGATGDEQRVTVHRDVAGVGRERTELLHEPDDLAGELIIGQHTAERVDAASLGTALDAVIHAPPPSLVIIEETGTNRHASTVGTLLGAEATQGTRRLRHRKHSSLLHGSLLGGGFDLLGGSSTLQNAAEFQFLRLHASQELDPLLELVGPNFERPERRLLLFGHRLGGSLTLGGVLGHRLHLGDNGGQFFEQCLDLVHERRSCIRVHGNAIAFAYPETRSHAPKPCS